LLISLQQALLVSETMPFILHEIVKQQNLKWGTENPNSTTASSLRLHVRCVLLQCGNITGKAECEL
jgi:hypothetical protein